jgi:hypothetical protein
MLAETLFLDATKALSVIRLMMDKGQIGIPDMDNSSGAPPGPGRAPALFSCSEARQPGPGPGLSIREARDPGPGPGLSIREALVPGPGPGLSIREALTPGPGRTCVLGRSRSQGRAGPGLRPGIAGWFCLWY